MENKVLGLHHITAIAGPAQRNYDFYTGVLGLRFVKKTVNFDDPGTYHFYYGNENGSPGTILTFFPWSHVKRGIAGNGMATEIGFSVPGGSLDFWKQRFIENNVRHGQITERFGEAFISFEDPDGLKLRLIVPSQEDDRKAWETKDLSEREATRGFHSVELSVSNIEPTAKVLTDIFGYRLLKQEDNNFRFVTDTVPTAAIVDIAEHRNGKPGVVAGGTNHHVAFRLKNEEVQLAFHDKIASYGLNITGKIDRNYFYSLYFREPGGILFELATDNPGFTVDEPLDELGTHLKLPSQYEPQRLQIERMLVPLKQ
jgi:glyoxalase family protein